MMFFQRNTDSGSIINFYISTLNSQDNPIAYGPGSILNGSLMLTTDKPLSVHQIRVIFQCEELDSSKKQTTTIFNVDSVVWGKSNNREIQELSDGSHMYLFAIRLPQVNYPPSMHISQFGHHVRYTLQGVIDLASEGPHSTALLPIIYLPLVTASSTSPLSKKTQVFEKEKTMIEMTAELIKPAYCPGDLCTVKLTTKNRSDSKITQVQLQLNAVATTLVQTSTVHKHHSLVTETFYVSIQKQSEHHDVFQFHIPSDLVPTFTNKLGRYIDIAYEIVLTIPLQLATEHSLTNTITLPVLIATVPPDYPVAIDLHEPLEDELPVFIPNIESPLPSPLTYPADKAYSVSPSHSFQMMMMDGEQEDIPLDDDFSLNTISDPSGHLMVPDLSVKRKTSVS
ncbi:hypothetical protein EDC96DRAFT_605249 [Choanephora cucurbitarum]|nr:hypothetical protein EDC96DRAFT_605249 [Choanephora cucurbitarum]